MNFQRLQMLRTRYGMSQESFADRLNISRQAVQKWESGAGVPTTNRLVEIANFFNVTIDYLLGNEDIRSGDETFFRDQIVPQYDFLPDKELYSAKLMVEYAQCIDEGKDIEKYHDLLVEISKLPVSKAREDIADVVFNLLYAAGQVPDYNYLEPSDLAGIKKLRKGSFPSMPKPANLESKIHGAWVGKICGCMLGKPVEGMQRSELKKLLKQTNNYPISRYILREELTPEILASVNFNLKRRSYLYVDETHYAPPDDDINYLALAAKTLELYGNEFSSLNTATVWVNSLPKTEYFTAERIAYRNITLGYTPPTSAEYKNPFRELIGGLIRGDYYGYINPGNFEMAAEMGWRDARLSHVKNGIYGEMFSAAMLAAAAVFNDTKTIIECALGEIPVTSRLHEKISCVINAYENGMPYTKWYDDFCKRYDENDEYIWCHVITNAEIVTAALLYGGGDFSRSICMAVGAAFDCDCNGATVGSVLGMMNGIKNIPEEWYSLFNNTLATTVKGFERMTFDELTAMTMKHSSLKHGRNLA